MDFVCNQVETGNVVCTPLWRTRSNLGETWFCVMTDGGERVRVFPHEDDSDLPGSPTVLYSTRVISPKPRSLQPTPAQILLTALMEKVGVWRVCASTTADRTSKNHEKGDVYEKDRTLGHLWYRKWYTEELLPAIKTKMPWWQGKHIVVQQDGATPPNGKGY
ncbi:unnamed protein product [Choristocarpus tenellus]